MTGCCTGAGSAAAGALVVVVVKVAPQTVESLKARQGRHFTVYGRRWFEEAEQEVV